MGVTPAVRKLSSTVFFKHSSHARFRPTLHKRGKHIPVPCIYPFLVEATPLTNLHGVTICGSPWCCAIPITSPLRVFEWQISDHLSPYLRGGARAICLTLLRPGIRLELLL